MISTQVYSVISLNVFKSVKKISKVPQLHEQCIPINLRFKVSFKRSTVHAKKQKIPAIFDMASPVHLDNVIT